MIKIAWTSLKNRKLGSILFIISLVAILIASTISLQTLFNVQAIVKDDITQYGRGSFDILVRSKGTQTTVEKTLGVIEENYLGVGDGGISINVWEKIKELDEVEIAAPVAALGYFTGFSRTFDLPFPETSSLLSTSFSTSDGVNEYKFGDRRETFYLTQDNYYYGYDHIVDLDYFGTVSSGEKPTFMIPQTYHLLVGIDMEEEQKLTGIPFPKLNRDLTLHEQELMSFAKNTPIIKVLHLKDPRIPVKAHVTQTVIPWESEDTISLKAKWGLSRLDMLESLQWDEKKQVLSHLYNLEPLSSTTFHFDFSDYITPFYFEPFSLDYKGNKTASENYATSVGESSVFYNTKPIDYQINEGYLSIKQVGKESGVPTYREIEQYGLPAYKTDTVPFILFPINAFTAKEYQKTLASSPLGIYHQAPTTTNDGIEVYETAVPGSFIASPAHGLISIEDVKFIKGNLPIDAIRIKVAGITEYNADAEKKILDVVEKLHQFGDFHIDIVAGASPKTMKMKVEGIGLVTQQWTSLGAATRITDGWSLTNLLISSLFILVGVIYLLNRVFFRKKLKQSELSLLIDIGWSRKHVIILNILELTILMSIASLFAFGLIILMINLKLLYTFSLFLFICEFLLVFFILVSTNIFTSRDRQINHQNILGNSILIRNLHYYKKYIRLTFLQLAMVTMLLFFVITSILKTVDLTGGTNLGAFINNAIHLSLFIVVIVAINLALITLIESNTAFLSLRKTELQTLRDIGWKHSKILSLCIKESAIWTFISILFGAIIGLITLIYLYDFSIDMIIQALIIVLCLYSLVFITSYYVIRSHISSI